MGRLQADLIMDCLPQPPPGHGGELPRHAQNHQLPHSQNLDVHYRRLPVQVHDLCFQATLHALHCLHTDPPRSGLFKVCRNQAFLRSLVRTSPFCGCWRDLTRCQLMKYIHRHRRRPGHTPLKALSRKQRPYASSQDISTAILQIVTISA